MNNKNVTIIDKASFDGVEFKVLSYNELMGASTTDMAMRLFFMNHVGLNLKQVQITLNNGSVKTEAGALYYSKGKIEAKSNLGGVGGILKKAVAGSVTNESTAKPTYSGVGDLFLEPSYKNYLILELNNNSIIIDKGLFFCCSNSIEIKPVMQKNISSAVLGGEGLFQIELSGKGIAILECNVPKCEIVQHTLTEGEELKVDGNFVIARTSGVSFSVTKSEKSLIGSALNGEGLLNTFKGEGTIWLAPTMPVYQRIHFGIPFDNNNMNNVQPR